MTLRELSRTILLLNDRPISKVRFARIIYFVHKDLVRKKFMRASDIAYVRSPLGPIPEGYLQLATSDPNIVIQHNSSSNLSYTNDEYTIRPDPHEETAMLEQYRNLLDCVSKTLKELHAFSTPELVAISQKEPGWVAQANGSHYYLTPADLKTPLPGRSRLPIIPITFKFKIHFSGPAHKAGVMQANLLRGMLSDIVRESTDLEHPDSDTLKREEPKREKHSVEKGENNTKHTPEKGKTDAKHP